MKHVSSFKEFLNEMAPFVGFSDDDNEQSFKDAKKRVEKGRVPEYYEDAINAIKPNNYLGFMEVVINAIAKEKKFNLKEFKQSLIDYYALEGDKTYVTMSVTYVKQLSSSLKSWISVYGLKDLPELLKNSIDNDEYSATIQYFANKYKNDKLIDMLELVGWADQIINDKVLLDQLSIAEAVRINNINPVDIFNKATLTYNKDPELFWETLKEKGHSEKSFKAVEPLFLSPKAKAKSDSGILKFKYKGQQKIIATTQIDRKWQGVPAAVADIVGLEFFAKNSKISDKGSNLYKIENGELVGKSKGAIAIRQIIDYVFSKDKNVTQNEPWILK